MAFATSSELGINCGYNVNRFKMSEYIFASAVYGVGRGLAYIIGSGIIGQSVWLLKDVIGTRVLNTTKGLIHIGEDLENFVSQRRLRNDCGVGCQIMGIVKYEWNKTKTYKWEIHSLESKIETFNSEHGTHYIEFGRANWQTNRMLEKARRKKVKHEAAFKNQLKQANSRYNEIKDKAEFEYAYEKSRMIIRFYYFS